MIDSKSPFLVLGAGSWGTALAIQAARVNPGVRLWGHCPDKMALLAESRENTQYLPDTKLPSNLECYSSLDSACVGVKEALIVVPSKAIREVLVKLRSAMEKATTLSQVRLILATKGIDPEKNQLLSDTVKELFPECSQVAFLSGPSFAKEVAADLPTAIVLSAEQHELADVLRTRFHSAAFRVYVNTDPVSTQLGGALKNVLAIAAGISDGLAFGANAKAALITRGLAEMSRLTQVLGGKAHYLMGLACVGDLILTCTDNQSRNRRFGLSIGQGKPTEQAVAEIGQVVEGIEAAARVHAWAQELGVGMPIVEQVYQILYQDKPARDAVLELMAREPVDEF